MSMLQIADYISGEVLEINEVNSKSINALKRAIASRNMETAYNTDFEVIGCTDEYVGQYFQYYIEDVKEKKENKDLGEIKRFVGIHYKPLEDFCYSVNSIEPLHICQALSANTLNTRYALNENDRDWLEELNLQRFELYRKVFIKYGVNMVNLNDLLWGEYKHDITDYRFL